MEFTHNTAASQYEAWQDGELAGEAHYRLEGDVADFDHTLVPPKLEGQGIAGALVQYALDDVRAQGAWKVRATCPYVVHWLHRHPEYADLLEG